MFRSTPKTWRVVFIILVALVFIGFIWTQTNLTSLAERNASGDIRGLMDELHTEFKLRKQIQADLSKCQHERGACKLELGNQLRKAGVSNQAASPQLRDRVIPLVIVTYNRVEYLKRCLDSISKHVTPRFAVFVSQDSDEPEVAHKIRQLQKQYKFTHIQHALRDAPKLEKPMREKKVYYYIAQHYGYIFRNVFDTMKYESIVIVEEDLEIAPDFFEYFEAMAPLLRKDPTLFCASAWNDNGQNGMVKDAEVLERSNFFPGLGWMITDDIWNEWRDKWPGGYWDDWIREPKQRQGRDCIRPEISRTKTFGVKGASAGQFFNKYLSKIKLNDKYVSWTTKDLTYLEKENYDKTFAKLVRSATPITSMGEVESRKEQTLIWHYNKFHELKNQLTKLGLMNDEKAGIPRTAYKGVVMFYKGDKHVLLAPKNIEQHL